MNSRKVGVAAALALAAFGATAANASVTWTASSPTRSAEARFTVIGGTNLEVVLTNTYAGDVTTTAGLLTIVYLQISGAPLSLTPVSALLTAGSIVHNGPNGGGNVGGEWQYRGGIAGPMGTQYGIGSAGHDIFGSPNFNGPDLDPPAGVNGANYGITSAGDNLATANGGLANDPIIKNSVTFLLSGLPVGFDLSRISGVVFQYGTDPSEPREIGTPTPGSLALLGLAGFAVSRRRRAC